MPEINLKESASALSNKKQELEKSIERLIDEFEKEIGRRIGDQNIEFSYRSDNHGGYISRVHLKVCL